MVRLLLCLEASEGVVPRGAEPLLLVIDVNWILRWFAVEVVGAIILPDLRLALHMLHIT